MLSQSMWSEREEAASHLDTLARMLSAEGGGEGERRLGGAVRLTGDGSESLSGTSHMPATIRGSDRSWFWRFPTQI